MIPFIMTSESVTEGHPDKVCDYISDSILDACLQDDPYARVACECLAKSALIVLAGEITSMGSVDYEAVVRTALRDIEPGDSSYADGVEIRLELTEQAPEIAGGVGKRDAERIGAGDQGIMFGYASDETPDRPDPMSLHVETFGTSDPEAADEFVRGLKSKWQPGAINRPAQVAAPDLPRHDELRAFRAAGASVGGLRSGGSEYGGSW